MNIDISKAAGISSDAAQSAIDAYTRWEIGSACCWIGFGVVCAIAGYAMLKSGNRPDREDENRDDETKFWLILTGIFLLVHGVAVHRLQSP